jgi:tRNA-dihydrouridine synthase
MGDIIKAVKDSGVMASAKIRSGFDKVNIEESVSVLVKSGADIITVHPRLATEYYSGKADWNLVRAVRLMTEGILILSGDIKSPEDAFKALELTGADGIMIGRQAIGSPYIFSQLEEYRKTGSYMSKTLSDIRNAMLDFARLFIETGRNDNIVPIRSALIQYVKNHKNSREIRYMISKASTLDELAIILNNW